MLSGYWSKTFLTDGETDRHQAGLQYAPLVVGMQVITTTGYKIQPIIIHNV